MESKEFLKEMEQSIKNIFESLKEEMSTLLSYTKKTYFLRARLWVDKKYLSPKVFEKNTLKPDELILSKTLLPKSLDLIFKLTKSNTTRNVFFFSIEKDENSLSFHRSLFIGDTPLFTYPKNYKQKKYSIQPVLTFLPLTVDLSKNKAYFNIEAKINVEFLDSSEITDTYEFWEKVFISISDYDNACFGREYKEIDLLETYYNKCSMHLELQKFGKSPLPTKEDILFMLDSKDEGLEEDIVNSQIEAIGLSFEKSQHKALFAVQKLLHETGFRSDGIYKGNKPGRHISTQNPFHFNGYLPTLEFAIADYYKYYGVKKYKTKRGKFEYSTKGSIEAIDALRSLVDVKFLFNYIKKYYKNVKGKKEKRYDKIQVIRPLITLAMGYQDLSHNEIEKSPAKKMTKIAIEVLPIFVDQLKEYYILKPANHYEEIKLCAPSASKYAYTFIDYLTCQAELKRRANQKLLIKISQEEMAYKLQMNSWIMNKNWKAIRTSTKKCYEIAKKLGYLSNIEIDVPAKTKEKKIDILTLNEDKFKHYKKTMEKRKEIEKESKQISLNDL